MNTLDLKSYAILEYLYDKDSVDYSELKEVNLIFDIDDMDYLYKEKLIKVTEHDMNDYIGLHPTACALTPYGKGEVEKFRIRQNEEKENAEFRKLQSNEIATSINYNHEAIKLGKEANLIAKKANKLSIVSIILAVAALITSIIAIFC